MTPEQERELELLRLRAQARARAAAQASTEDDSLPAAVGRGVVSAAGDFNTGLADLTGTRGLDVARRFGVRPPGQEAEGAIGAGMEMAGETLPLAVGGIGAMAARAPASLQTIGQAAMSPGVRARAGEIGRSILDFARQRPATFIGTEGTAAVGAGAGQNIAQQNDVGPVGQSLSMLGGGVAGGVAPVAGINMLARGRDAITRNLLPFTEAGGRLRANAQMQARAADPEAAAIAARTGPEGVSPARRTQDERLLAQERRVLEDDPRMDAAFRNDLQHAQQTAQRELLDVQGQPRSRSEWERSVMESVAAPGTTIRQGHTDEMLDQAYKSFEPMYGAAKGHTVFRSGLGKELAEAADDAAVMASKGDRRRVKSWLQNEMTALNERSAGGAFRSSDMLTLRSRVRDQARRARKRQDDVAAELLERAELRLTQALDEGLPPDAQATLREADQLYRKYKVVEDAVFRSGEEQLTPARMLSSLRSMAESPGRFARGAEQEMRTLAQSGRLVSEVLDDPQAASRMVRGLDEEGRRSVKADYVKTLYQQSRTNEVTDDGVELISGSRLHALLHDTRDTARALGLSGQEFSRLNKIALELRRMETKSPGAVDRLFEDGPSNVMQLMAALVGAKAGQRTAGQGIGSSLVLAQFFSNKMRNALAKVTADKATELMIQAHRDPELYAALLTGPTSSVQKQNQAAQALNVWLARTTDPLREDDQNAP